MSDTSLWDVNTLTHILEIAVCFTGVTLLLILLFANMTGNKGIA
jgi:hypothetical protein